nr:malic enzyme-like NAD(P)-binding protein [Bacillus sp. BF9-10]
MEYPLYPASNLTVSLFFFSELGLGTIVVRASVMIDGMFAAATEAVAEGITRENLRENDIKIAVKEAMWKP